MITVCVQSADQKCAYCWASKWCMGTEIPQKTVLERYKLTQEIFHLQYLPTWAKLALLPLSELHTQSLPRAMMRYYASGDAERGRDLRREAERLRMAERYHLDIPFPKVMQIPLV